MRIIKFKGKSLEDGQWNIGDLTHAMNLSFINPGYPRSLRLHTFGVYPATVCQFTGFLDKNDDFNSSVLKIKDYFDSRDSRCLQFPPKKYVPKNLTLIGAHKPLFHIIRLKENRFKVVWIKNKH